ncbi:MAG: HAD hydrolase-like protein [bacterium]|nr:HAD hydrolase-like protein [bacterium]
MTEKRKKNLIVFDMDGVIIDVSASYRDVVRRTAGLFFQPARESERLPDPLFGLSDLAAVKQSGGLNNDWDLTFEVISLFFSLIDYAGNHEIRDPWRRYRAIIGCCDVNSMADFLQSTDRPLASLLKQHGRYENEFVKSIYQGDVGSGNIIKQIFQEIYLGDTLFRSTYNLDAEVYRAEGFILREKVLIDRQLLEELAHDNVLAIATGRPRAEAEYPLKHFHLDQYFAHVLTLDDCQAEEKRTFEQDGRTVSLSKPNPFMLDAIEAKCREPFDNFYYIGDMPDDMLAAAGAAVKCKGIGLLLTAPDKKSLTKNLTATGADYIIDSFEALSEIVL